MAALKRGSVDDARASSHHEEAHHPYSRNDEVPALFVISHYGKEKAFVEHLHNALLSANYTVSFDVDTHSLPKRSSFPPYIHRAAHGCKLGVVVLSDDFLTSKSSMLELEALVQYRGPNPKVLPLFYKLHPKDLKSHEKLSKWRQVWKQKAGEHADTWEQAVKALRSFNGEVFVEGTSETIYIKRVVRTICNLMSRPISYDFSSERWHQRFTQQLQAQQLQAHKRRILLVASQFDKAARQCDKVSMVGLYGVAGMGKTTMCKIMTNFYNADYLGKSYHIKFPNDGDNKRIVQGCTKALKKLTNLSDQHLCKVDSFDQVVQLMREHLRRYDVFLAIDNVWESSVEAAKIILGVSFSASSKILLMSRSEEVLKYLLKGHSNTSLGRLPSPNQEEAFQIFQENFELGDLNSLVNRKLLDSVLNRCFFSGNYHALALKALGQYVKRACVRAGLDMIEHSLSQILKGIADTVLQNVEDPILLNYVNLAAKKKHLFLDIVVVVKQATSRYDAEVEVTFEKAHQWLSLLYKEYSKSMITNLIYELSLDGLIQLENIDDKSAEKIIRVHDLYSYLAQREAARSARFLTDGSTRSVKEIEWERLERVILKDQRHHSPHFIEDLQQQECRNLQVLSAENIGLRSGIHLDLMPSLCVLKIEKETLRSIKNWSVATGLAIVHLVNLHCVPPLEPIPSIPCLESLIIENVKTMQAAPNLDECQHLKELVLAEASVFKDWKASYFSSLMNLESLQIEHFNSITRVLNLHALVNLQMLCIQRCESVERIEGLDALKNLKILHVEECPCLRNLDGLSGLLQLEVMYVRNADLNKMPDLSGLTCLESLVLYHNKSMEEVVGGLSPALKTVDVRGFEALKRLPDLSGLTCLESLVLYDNTSMEEVVGGLSPALKNVDVCGCDSLKRMPDLSALTCLERLVLYDNKSMEEVVGGLSPALKNVDVRRCEALKRMPDLSGLTCLERLALNDNKSMEEVVGGLSPALKNVDVCGCEALKRMPDLSGLTCLETLVLNDNKAMEEVMGGLSPALNNVDVRRCEALKRMPDLSGLTCLERLVLYDNKSMEEVVGGLSPALQNVDVRGCELLKRMPDLIGLTCLETLVLYDNKSMEEVVGGLSPALQNVDVRGCEALKRMPDLRGLTCLESLVLYDNKSMEEVVGGLSPALKNVDICGCEALKRMPDLSGLTCLESLVLNDNKSMEEVVGGLNPALKNVDIRGCDALKRMPDLSGHILQGIGGIVLQHVDNLILLNYVNLAVEKKHMLLDIVVVVKQATWSYDAEVEVTYNKAHQWLSFLYKEYSESTITNLISELAMDGLIQLENIIIDGRSEKMIRVHGLYCDLAQREAATSARFLTDGSTRSVTEIEWERLERVILREPHLSSHFIEELQQQECPKLQVLCAENIDFRSGIHLDLMPSLCVLDLKRGTLRSVKSWSAATGLAVVHLAGLECAPALEPIPNIPCLEELIIEDVKTVEGSPNVDGCQHLEKLVLAEASVFKNWKASYFSSLTNLESLQIEHFNGITRVLNLNALVNLQLLRIQRCESVERIEGLNALKNLQFLYVEECLCLRNLDGLSGLLHLEGIYVRSSDLKKIPDLSGLTRLKSLVLYDNKSMEEVMGGLSLALKNVDIRGCEALKRMPDLSGLTCLERLELLNNESTEEVGGLSPALKVVRVNGCGALKKMPDVSGLTCLQSLELEENESMEEVGGENLSSTLESLNIYCCKCLRRFPGLNDCDQLRKLKASAYLIRNIDKCKLPSLQELHLIGGQWTSIERLISGATHLQSLTIEECDSLVKLEVGCLPSNLERLEVRECEALEEIGDLSVLHSLHTLTLIDCPSLKKLGDSWL